VQYYYPVSAVLLPSWFSITNTEEMTFSSHTEFELVPLSYTDKQQVSYFS